MALDLTDIPETFGSGGANLTPGGSAGEPSLVDILTEHKEGLEELETGVNAGLTASKKTVTIGHADLTSAVDGAAQAFNIGSALPANSRIVGVDFRGYTPFTGGGASALACDIGSAGDVDALIDGADLFAAAVDGGPATIPQGIRPNKTFAGATQLIATLTPDGSTNGVDFTAGAITIDVLYVVLA